MKTIHRILVPASLLLSAFSAAAVKPKNSALSAAFAFPVPYVPSKQTTRVITFQNLPASGRIRIFTISGKLVREIALDGTGQSTWDAKTSSGQDAASGTYLYLIETGGDSKKGELIIVR